MRASFGPMAHVLIVPSDVPEVKPVGSTVVVGGIARLRVGGPVYRVDGAEPGPCYRRSRANFPWSR